jgi:uptake hydrogenase large subunit
MLVSMSSTQGLLSASRTECITAGRIQAVLLASSMRSSARRRASSLTALFMPEFTRPVHAGRARFAQAQRRFASPGGEHARAAVAARQRGFELMGILGGRWPHAHSVQPGGSRRAIEASERLRLLARVREFLLFLERQVIGDSIDALLALPDEAALRAWADAGTVGDLRLFLRIAADIQLAKLGGGPAVV